MIRLCFIAGLFYIVGCKSSTQIVTIPEGASLFISGRYYGDTPCKFSTTQSKEDKIRLVIEKDGFLPLDTSIHRDGKINRTAHMLGWLFVFPFHYDRNFKSKYVFKLSEYSSSFMNSDSVRLEARSNSEKLKILMEAFKQGQISKSEFEIQKKIIISGQQ
jgi:hypothetical protein